MSETRAMPLQIFWIVFQALESLVHRLDPLVAAVGLVAGANLFEWLGSRNAASSLASLGAIVALLVACWDKYWERRLRLLDGRERMLEEQIGVLTQAVASHRRYSEAQTESIRHLESEQAASRFDVAQLSAEILRLRGVLAHSGSRRRLQPAIASDGREVLVVEDDPALRRAAARLLSHHGLAVTVAASVDEALTLIRARPSGAPFGFVVLDLGLEDGSGLEVLDHLRQAEVPTQAVVCTGESDPHVLAGARARGAAATLVKPVELEELMALLGVDLERPQTAENP